MGEYFHRIQVLRFAAAAMVLLGHAQIELENLPGLGPAGHTPLRNVVFFAGGVDIFFVVSGFIMYSISRADFGRPGAAPRFFLRRVARIVPSYWFFTTAMIAAAALFSARVTHNDIGTAHALASYLFIPAENSYGESYPVLALGWTLNFEMLFYVVFACALALPRRTGLALVFTAIGMLAILGGAAPPAALPFAFWCNPIVLEFLFGIALAQAHAAGLRLSTAAGAGVALLGVVLLYLGSQGSPASPFWTERPLWMGVPALLICAGFALMPEAPPRGRPWRLLILGGDASYALYLSHPFCLTLMAMLWTHAAVSSAWLFVAASLAFSIAVSIGFHLVLEKPVTRALNAGIQRAALAFTSMGAPSLSEQKGRL